MSGQGIAQILVYVVALIALGYTLGAYMARVYTADRLGGRRLRLLPAVEGGFYRAIRVDAKKEHDWKIYVGSVVVFSVLFWSLLYAIQRLQGHLFLNPDHMKGVPAHL